ncbi:MAG: type IV-A pilus assembly ATPase PilB [Gammaproteobacteria bacterium]|nr:type IV-A pilus assembly ATPase PilB [Gammaproteobacteria bacterium]MYK27224.1 type IV-A pilus assembly ATPase PilB [Gammaproteobacteria bacterium]
MDTFNQSHTAMAARRLPMLDLDAFDLDVLPEPLIDEGILRRGVALPLRQRGNRLFAAVADPSDLEALDDLQQSAGLVVEPVLVEADKLKAVIEALRQSRRAEGRLEGFGAALGGSLENLGSGVLAVEPEADEADETLDASGANDAPIVRFVNQVLLDAADGGVSDIHFEPFETAYRIRFRTDGLLAEVAKPPRSLGRRLAARLKVMAELDIAERRVPQDGRIKIRLSKSRTLDLRVNTLPTLWGEKVVLRILDPASASLGLDALGFEADQKALFTDALERPEGMILVTGPTGSGKTVTLYTALNRLNTPERNIATAEDPVEINLAGINQVNVNPKVGLDFAVALRAFLRQDPDVLMVGEIRDLTTAEIAVKAAQTGHLVLSTLHTNSAAETLTRMRNIGIAAFNLATSVRLIIAQRLARRLCEDCKMPFAATADALLRQGFGPELINRGGQLFQARQEGCPACRKGYKGRIGIYEVVRVTPSIASLVMAGGSSLQLAEEARRQGFMDLRTACLAKVAEGCTSLVEANRITGTGDGG